MTVNPITQRLSTLTNTLDPMNIQPNIYAYMLRTCPGWRPYKRLREMPSQSINTRQLRKVFGDTSITADEREERFLELKRLGLIEYECVITEYGWRQHLITVKDFEHLTSGITEEEARNHNGEPQALLNYFSERYERKNFATSLVFTRLEKKLAGRVIVSVGGQLDEAKALVDFFFGQPTERVKAYSFRAFYNAIGEMMVSVAENREIQAAMKRQNAAQKRFNDQQAAAAAAAGQTIAEYDATIRRAQTAYAARLKAESGGLTGMQQWRLERKQKQEQIEREQRELDDE